MIEMILNGLKNVGIGLSVAYLTVYVLASLGALLSILLGDGWNNWLWIFIPAWLVELGLIGMAIRGEMND